MTADRRAARLQFTRSSLHRVSAQMPSCKFNRRFERWTQPSQCELIDTDKLFSESALLRLDFNPDDLDR